VLFPSAMRRGHSAWATWGSLSTVVIVSVTTVVFLAGFSWPVGGSDGGHDRLTSKATISPGDVASLRQAWMFDDPNVGASRLAVSGGRVFAGAPLGPLTGSPPGIVLPPPPLQVLGAATGAVDWTAGGIAFPPCGDIGESDTSMPAPVVRAGRVYLLSSDTLCVTGGSGETSYSAASLDAATGDPTPFGDVDVSSAPVVATDGTVYVAESPGGPPYGPVSLVGGSFSFTPPDGDALGTPAVGPGTVYVVTGGGQLDAVSRATSKLLWSAAVSFGPGPIPTPSLGQGRVYVAGGTVVSAFDAGGQADCVTAKGSTTCRPLWTATLPDALTTDAPVPARNRLYVRASNHLYALEAWSGTMAWSATLGTVTDDPTSLGSPAVTGGVVFVGSEDGQLQAFDAAGTDDCADHVCSPLWTAALVGPPGASQPIVADGSVYVGAADTDGTSSAVYKFSPH
jgi:outer membrane protein assembly factor BamB